MDWFEARGPVAQAFIATAGTYPLTAFGTLPVLFLRNRHTNRILTHLLA